MASNKTTRRRDIVFRRDKYLNYQYLYGRSGTVISQVGPFSGFETVAGKQLTVSEGHPWTRRSRFKGEDIGGEFFTSRNAFDDLRELDENPQPQHSMRDYQPGPWGHDFVYQGPVYAVRPSTSFPPDLSKTQEELDALGATAIARCKPTNSPAELSVALAELIREGIPSMVGSQMWRGNTGVHRKLASEYLGLQFGWLPLVSDIKSTAEAILQWEELVSQYERDAGRLVRRGYDFPTDRSVEVVDVTPSGGADLYVGGGRVLDNWCDKDGNGREVRRLTREREIVRDIWFRGGFTYHLPTGYHSRNEMMRIAAEANHVLGLELTPEVVWNLAPWSWAVDWFSNTGDVLSNVSDIASDGLVLQYGYLMEKTIITDTYTNTGANLRSTGRRPIVSKFTTVIKKRRRATPFGFGLEGSLSPRQLSIIAALGITKAPR